MASQNYHSGLEVAANEKPPYTSNTMATYPSSGGSGGGEHGVVKSSPEKEKTICGVRRATFWLALALAILIIAGAVGGGIGGRMAARKIRKNSSSYDGSSSSSSSDTDSSSNNNANNNNNNNQIFITRTITTTTTTTSPTPTTNILVPTTGYLNLDCPSLTSRTLRAFSSSFTVTCGSDSPGPNIIAIVAYSILDCARACATYNENASAGVKCVGATFNSYLAYVDAHKGTCWLKSSLSGQVVNGLPGVNPNSYAQVILQ